MSIAAIIVMLLAIAVIWGTAGWAIVVSLRRAEKKSSLVASQGGFEPFSPRAFRDLEQAMQDSSMPAERLAEMRQAHEEQREALARYDQRFYE